MKGIMSTTRTYSITFGMVVDGAPRRFQLDGLSVMSKWEGFTKLERARDGAQLIVLPVGRKGDVIEQILAPDDVPTDVELLRATPKIWTELAEVFGQEVFNARNSLR